MAKVTIADTCIGCGACTTAAPEIFELDGGKAKVLVEELSPEQLEVAKSAVGICPVQAIKVEE